MNERALKRKQQDWLRQDVLEIDSAISALMQHRQGRKFLYWVLTEAKALGHQPFTGNALTSAFESGEMNVGLKIMARLVEAAPDQFFLMQREATDERTERKRAELDLTGSDGDDGSVDEHWRDRPDPREARVRY